MKIIYGLGFFKYHRVSFWPIQIDRDLHDFKKHKNIHSHNETNVMVPVDYENKSAHFILLNYNKTSCKFDC